MGPVLCVFLAEALWLSVIVFAAARAAFFLAARAVGVLFFHCVYLVAVFVKDFVLEIGQRLVGHYLEFAPILTPPL